MVVNEGALDEVAVSSHGCNIVHYTDLWKLFGRILQGLQQCLAHRSSQQGNDKTTFFVPCVRPQGTQGCKCGRGRRLR